MLQSHLADPETPVLGESLLSRVNPAHPLRSLNGHILQFGEADLLSCNVGALDHGLVQPDAAANSASLSDSRLTTGIKLLCQGLTTVLRMH